MFVSTKSSKEEIMPPKISAIVIAQHARFREGIQILLTSISRIDEVFPVESLTEALSLTAITAPFAVIMDSQSANLDLSIALRQIGDTWHGASRIVLVEDKKESHQAKVNGAELVLVKGFNASKFISEIEEILKKR